MVPGSMELDLSNFDMYLELRRSQDKAEEHEKESEELRQKVEEMKRTMLNMSLTQQDLEAQLEKLQAERDQLEEKMKLEKEQAEMSVKKQIERLARRKLSTLQSVAMTEDGDFVALQERRFCHVEESPMEESLVEVSLVEEHTAHETGESADHGSGDAENWSCTEAGFVFAHAHKATPEEFMTFFSAMDKPLTRNPANNMNILHHVLDIGRSDIAYELVNNLESDKIKMLVQECDVTVAQIKGKKNVLHYATEQRDTMLAAMILDKLDGHPDMKMKLLRQETPVQVEGQRPRTLPPLHLAAFIGCKEFNHLDVVDFLLSKNANTEVENDKGSTALYWAARYGYTDTVRLLLTKGKARTNSVRKMGLVHPVVLASAMGYVDILRLLLEHGKECPIHHAAKEGYSEIIECLLDHNARVDAADENGDTAILYAARYGHPRCLQVLLRRGANIEHKNHAGDDLISLAIDSEDDTLLEITLQYYKKLRADKPMTRPPILIAAENGECEKIQTLLNMKLDPHATDEEGNTLLHLAAMNDEAEVIRRFHKQVNIDAVNAKGNTALHEACCRGHAASITALINNKATGSIGNYQGQTALHVAACCREIEPDTVKELMSYIMKSHAWESINIKDNEGKNALHLAAVHATPEVMWEFRHIPVKMADGDGNIALHKAARPGEPEALTMMLDIYETMKRDADINTQNNNHETVLHLVAKNGFSDHVERLVNFGADLSIQDQNGDTVCHTLTKLSAKYPNKAKVYVAVFEEILHEAAAWWCTKHNLHFPHGDQKMHEFYTRQAVTLLLTDIYNKENNNVLALACRVGAADILLLVLSQKEVLRFKHGDKMFYNVTNMTPLTSSHVGFSRGDAGDHTDRFSYIEWLVSKKNPIMACKVLNVQPFREIEEAYSSVAAWTFSIIILIHITYMTLFSLTGLHMLHVRRHCKPTCIPDCPPNATHCDEYTNMLDIDHLVLYLVVPIEPAIIIMFTLYVVCKWDLQTMLGPAYVGRNVIYQMTGFAKEAMPVTISVLYSAAVLLWVLAYTLHYRHAEFFLSVAVWMGWLYTINFTRGFRRINYFWRLIQQMLLKDIIKFLGIYTFVLLAFSFAIHAMFVTVAEASQKYPTPIHTMFTVFDLMIGMGNLFDGNLDTMDVPTYKMSYLKVVYVTYRVLATILLLNMVIAMMNDSYSAILHQHVLDWRLDSVKLGCTIEKAIPISTRIFSQIKFMKGLETRKPGEKPPEDAPDLPHALCSPDIWYIAIPLVRLTDQVVVEDEKDFEVLRTLNRKMGSMEHRFSADLQLLRHDVESLKDALVSRRGDRHALARRSSTRLM
ncbi:hypothetical protein BaRGS_00019290 [Batillaria attramentaria]|uniref:Ion transport domain-containing protein n=1 Tax=Batillaria attramentaria TaxID=370345 RepID=A0ABD0KQD5_9CAEN